MFMIARRFFLLSACILRMSRLTYVWTLVVAASIFLMPCDVLAIDILPGANGPYIFDTQPLGPDWLTHSLSYNNGIQSNSASSIMTVEELDTAVATISPNMITTTLPTDSGDTISQNSRFRWHSVQQLLESNTTGNSASMLMATLHNAGPNNVANLHVTYDYTRTGAIEEEISGLRVYYNSSGLASGWNAIGTFALSGPVSFDISNLGTDFGTNPLYVLWVDDNGLASGATNENNHTIDNVTFTPTPGPDGGFWGNRVGSGMRSFDGNDSLDIASQAGGSIAHQPDGPGGAMNNSLHLNGGNLSVVTEQVDLRGGGPNLVSIDVKVWEDDLGSDFETADLIRVVAEHSPTGHIFTPVDLLPMTAGGAAPNDPNDALKSLEAFSGSSNIGPYRRYTAILPPEALTVRLRITAANDSTTEHFYFDNLTVSPVPEPASVAMIGLGMIGMIGYGIRRRRSA